MDSNEPLQIIDLRPNQTHNFSIFATLPYPDLIKKVLCIDKLNCSLFAILGSANI